MGHRYRAYWTLTRAYAGTSGSVSGWFTDTGGKGAGQHGASCTPHSPKCVCTDLHKCTPNVSIGGVNLFKQGWLPSAPGECRPELSVYGTNYFDPACCPANTYGGPAKSGPFNISCTPGKPGTGGGYGGGGSGTPGSGSGSGSGSNQTGTTPTNTTTTSGTSGSGGLGLNLSSNTIIIIVVVVIILLIVARR